MAKLRQTQSVENKHKLSNTLRNWLPILQSSLGDLGEAIGPFVESNPVVEVESGFEEEIEKKQYKDFSLDYVANSRTERIEARVLQKKSLYEILDEQLVKPLFPTPKSLKIGQFIINNLDDNGYYDGLSEDFCEQNNITIDEFEKVRKRFAFVEPVGIAALDIYESFLFQLDNSDISDEAFPLAVEIINNFKNIYDYSKDDNFTEVMRVISKFKNPPAIEYKEDSNQIIADLMIYFNNENEIEVKLNNGYYPTVKIDTNYAIDNKYITKKIKEAKSLVDALEMRKATLYKVGLMIVEYQYDFFLGGTIMPLTLKTLADEFGHNPSTISRAIANKYIACDRGVFAMKDFFTTAIDNDVSNTSIKDFVIQSIKEEDHQKPLSDMKLLAMVTEKFKVDMVRRTIAKYRQQLNILGSSERKKMYKLGI